LNCQKVAELINSPDRITTLTTIGAGDSPNTAIIGSAFMTDDHQILIGLADNRTLRNLIAHPKVVLLAFRPGKTVLDWQGGRLYLELESMEAEGDRFDEMIGRIRATAGRMAARSIRRLAVCRIFEVRPLADLAGGI